MSEDSQTQSLEENISDQFPLDIEKYIVADDMQAGLRCLVFLTSVLSDLGEDLQLRLEAIAQDATDLVKKAFSTAASLGDKLLLMNKLSALFGVPGLTPHLAGQQAFSALVTVFSDLFLEAWTSNIEVPRLEFTLTSDTRSSNSPTDNIFGLTSSEDSSATAQDTGALLLDIFVHPGILFSSASLLKTVSDTFRSGLAPAQAILLVTILQTCRPEFFRIQEVIRFGFEFLGATLFTRHSALILSDRSQDGSPDIIITTTAGGSTQTTSKHAKRNSVGCPVLERLIEWLGTTDQDLETGGSSICAFWETASALSKRGAETSSCQFESVAHFTRFLRFFESSAHLLSLTTYSRSGFTAQWPLSDVHGLVALVVGAVRAFAQSAASSADHSLLDLKVLASAIIPLLVQPLLEACGGSDSAKDTARSVFLLTNGLFDGASLAGVKPSEKNPEDSILLADCITVLDDFSTRVRADGLRTLVDAALSSHGGASLVFQKSPLCSLILLNLLTPHAENALSGASEATSPWSQIRVVLQSALGAIKLHGFFVSPRQSASLVLYIHLCGLAFLPTTSVIKTLRTELEVLVTDGIISPDTCDTLYLAFLARALSSTPPGDIPADVRSHVRDTLTELGRSQSLDDLRSDIKGLLECAMPTDAGLAHNPATLRLQQLIQQSSLFDVASRPVVLEVRNVFADDKITTQEVSFLAKVFLEALFATASGASGNQPSITDSLKGLISPGDGASDMGDRLCYFSDILHILNTILSRADTMPESTLKMHAVPLVQAAVLLSFRPDGLLAVDPATPNMSAVVCELIDLFQRIFTSYDIWPMLGALLFQSMPLFRAEVYGAYFEGQSGGYKPLFVLAVMLLSVLSSSSSIPAQDTVLALKTLIDGNTPPSDRTHSSYVRAQLKTVPPTHQRYVVLHMVFLCLSPGKASGNADGGGEAEVPVTEFTRPCKQAVSFVITAVINIFDNSHIPKTAASVTFSDKAVDVKVSADENSGIALDIYDDAIERIIAAFAEERNPAVKQFFGCTSEAFLPPSAPVEAYASVAVPKLMLLAALLSLAVSAEGDLLCLPQSSLAKEKQVMSLIAFASSLKNYDTPHHIRFTAYVLRSLRNYYLHVYDKCPETKNLELKHIIITLVKNSLVWIKARTGSLPAALCHDFLRLKEACVSLQVVLLGSSPSVYRPLGLQANVASLETIFFAILDIEYWEDSSSIQITLDFLEDFCEEGGIIYKLRQDDIYELCQECIGHLEEFADADDLTENDFDEYDD